MSWHVIEAWNSRQDSGQSMTVLKDPAVAAGTEFTTEEYDETYRRDMSCTIGIVPAAAC